MDLSTYQNAFHILRFIMRLIYFHLLRFCTANQYLDLGVPLNQIDNAHDGIDCFLTASDPYVNSCSVPRGSISQVTLVTPIYEIRKPRMGRSLWSVDHDFRSVHQLIQCIPEILIIIIHLYILRQTGICPAAVHSFLQVNSSYIRQPSPNFSFNIPLFRPNSFSPIR